MKKNGKRERNNRNGKVKEEMRNGLQSSLFPVLDLHDELLKCWNAEEKSKIKRMKEEKSEYSIGSGN